MIERWFKVRERGSTVRVELLGGATTFIQYARDFGKVHVDLFETAVAQSMGLPSQRCITAEFCGKGLAVEHNGDVFSCDHYVYPEYRLGNIATTHWGEMRLRRDGEEVRVCQT